MKYYATCIAVELVKGNWIYSLKINEAEGGTESLLTLSLGMPDAYKPGEKYEITIAGIGA